MYSLPYHSTSQPPIPLGLFLMNWLKSTLQPLKKTSTSANLLEKNLGGVAEVSSPIPASLQGSGKIVIASKGGLRKVNAVTSDSNALLTGAIVIISEIVDEHTAKVTRSK